MKHFLSLTIISLLSYSFAYAEEDDEISDEELEMYIQTDSIVGTNHAFHIEEANATIGELGEYTILDVEETNHLVSDYWDNPEMTDITGSIIPRTDIYDNVPYVFIITCNKDGYISDDDAKDIDYDDLMDEWKKDTEEWNKSDEAEGLVKRELKGWADKPYYDEKNHTIHWAKLFQFEDHENETINYEVLILGKEGYINITAVGSGSQFEDMKECVTHIIDNIKYDEGYRYEDFDSSKDKVAQWTLGGLVAGKLLAKAGFFAKFGKVILIALAAIGGFFAKFFKRKKKEEE